MTEAASSTAHKLRPPESLLAPTSRIFQLGYPWDIVNCTESCFYCFHISLQVLRHLSCDILSLLAEFKRAVKVATGQELSDNVLDTIFKIFDLDGDDCLSHGEFLGVLRNRIHRGLRVTSWHHCFSIQQMIATTFLLTHAETQAERVDRKKLWLKPTVPYCDESGRSAATENVKGGSSSAALRVMFTVSE